MPGNIELGRKARNWLSGRYSTVTLPLMFVDHTEGRMVPQTKSRERESHGYRTAQISPPEDDAPGLLLTLHSDWSFTVQLEAYS